MTVKKLLWDSLNEEYARCNNRLGKNPKEAAKPEKIYEHITNYIKENSLKHVFISIGCHNSEEQEFPSFLKAAQDLLILNIDVNCNLRVFFKHFHERNNHYVSMRSVINEFSITPLGQFISTLLKTGVSIILMDSCGAWSTLDHLSYIPTIQHFYGPQFFIIESYFHEKPVALLSGKVFDPMINNEEKKRIMHAFHTDGQLDPRYGIRYEHLSMLPPLNELLKSPLFKPATEGERNVSTLTLSFIQKFWIWLQKFIRGIIHSLSNKIAFFNSKTPEPTPSEELVSSILC